MRKHMVMMSALVAALASFAAPFTDGGVTYTPNDEVTRRQPVVTGVNVTGMVESVSYTRAEVDRRIATNAPVRSVNGKAGAVVIGAGDVGALPNNRTALEGNANFANAVRNVQVVPSVRKVYTNGTEAVATPDGRIDLFLPVAPSSKTDRYDPNAEPSHSPFLFPSYYAMWLSFQDVYSWSRDHHRAINDRITMGDSETLAEAKRYADQHRGGGGGTDTNAVREIVTPMISEATNGLRRVDDMAVYGDVPGAWIFGGGASGVDGLTVGLFEESEFVPGLFSLCIRKNGVLCASTFSRVYNGTELYVEFDLFNPEVFASMPVASRSLVPGVVDRLATTNGVRIVETNLTAKLDTKRDLTNNVCAADWWSEWKYSDGRDHGGFSEEFGYVFQEGLVLCDENDAYITSLDRLNNVSFFYTTADEIGKEHMEYFATRSRVCVSNELFTTYSFVTNEVAAAIAADNPAFSNAVLAVELNFATNEVTSATYIAVTNALVQLGFDEDALAELPGGKVYGSVGALLAALAAAVAWMRKKKVDKLKVTDTATGTDIEVTADNGVADVADFFKESNSLLMGTIRYSHHTVPSGGALKDRAINAFTFSGGSSLPNFPSQVVGSARDFLLDVTATAAASNLTLPESGATSVGDALAFEASHTYLVAVTEIAAKKYYIRVIDTTSTND